MGFLLLHAGRISAYIRPTRTRAQDVHRLKSSELLEESRCLALGMLGRRGDGVGVICGETSECLEYKAAVREAESAMTQSTFQRTVDQLALVAALALEGCGVTAGRLPPSVVTAASRDSRAMQLPGEGETRRLRFGLFEPNRIVLADASAAAKGNGGKDNTNGSRSASDASASVSSLTVTGTIKAATIQQEVGMFDSNGGVMPGATMGPPKFSFQLKERSGIDYEMTIEDAERAGLVSVTRLTDSGSLQTAHVQPVEGWQVKVFYRKEGKRLLAVRVGKLEERKPSAANVDGCIG